MMSGYIPEDYLRDNPEGELLTEEDLEFLASDFTMLLDTIPEESHEEFFEEAEKAFEKIFSENEPSRPLLSEGVAGWRFIGIVSNK